VAKKRNKQTKPKLQVASSKTNRHPEPRKSAAAQAARKNKQAVHPKAASRFNQTASRHIYF